MQPLKRIAAFMLFFTLLITYGKAQEPAYLNPELPVSERVADLLSRMTLAEKVGQMTQADHLAFENFSDVKTYFIGSVLSGGGSDPAAGNAPIHWTDLYDALQAEALQTRLQIPMIYGIDAVHGHSNVVGAVIFPHNIGLGATRDAALVEEIARATAIEIAATGIDWTFAPCVAVPRNERWGRTYEGFAEDPTLVSTLGAAAVKGLQADSLTDPTAIIACAKHYLGDGGTTDGDDQGNTQIDEATLRAIHLPPYEAAIAQNVRTIMASYNSWNGLKLHGSEYLLTDLLKEELGFSGFIVSDWAAIDQLPGDYDSDVVNSINAGIDMVMVPNEYETFITSLTNAVNSGAVSMTRIDDAVGRILTVKFEQGLFERPYADRSLLSEIGKAEHRQLGRRSVRQSLVLLDKRDGILPLAKTSGRLLVAGEHADDIGLQCGGWTIQWGGAGGEITEGTTILEGLREVAPEAQIIYDAGGNFTTEEGDIAIVVIGEQPYAEGDGDRDDLNLDKNHIQLLRKLKNTGVPVISILISGRPMLIEAMLANSDAVFAAWLPGSEGAGIADVLFGDYQPSGLSPMTWPRSMAHIPGNIGDTNYDPLFAYGHGIVDFADADEVSAPHLRSALLAEDGTTLELRFNKAMNIAASENPLFTVLANGTRHSTGQLQSLPGDAYAAIIIAEDAIAADTEITLTLDSGSIKAADGSVVTTIGPRNVVDMRSFTPQRHTIPGRIEAEDYSAMHNVQTENTSDDGGGLNVGWIDAGDWLSYECNISEAGTYLLTMRVASLNQSGIVQVLVDEQVVLSRSLPVTNGWQNWQSVSDQVVLPAGQHTLRLQVAAGGWNINWLHFDFVTPVDENPDHGFENLQLRNFPNPFNPNTNITFRLDRQAKVRVEIFTNDGRMVANIPERLLPAGSNRITWQAENRFASGTYFYRLIIAGRPQSINKMVLIR
jgi:beta-glucosidase